MACALDFFATNLVGSAFFASAAASAAFSAAALASASASTTGNTGGFPYLAISFLILSADALMGMPVQWNAKGKRVSSPLRRWYADANSSLDSEKAWPRCSMPFMYGYGKLPKNLGGLEPEMGGTRTKPRRVRDTRRERGTDDRRAA